MTPATTEKPKVNEIFLVQLTRAELELCFGHISILYAVWLAREQTPDAKVLTGEGIEPFPDWLAGLGAKQMAQIATTFYSGPGLEGARQLANKFLRLLGRREL